MRHNPDHGIMGQFMEGGAIVIDLFAEGRLRRHLHIIRAGGIESLRPADAKIRAGRFYQRLGMGDDLAFRQGRGIGGEAGAQAFALRDVEHGEAFEKRNGAGVLAVLHRAGLLRFGNEAVGIDDGGSLLALADIAARFQGLAEGHPALRGIFARDRRAPKQQHIDAGIAPPGKGVARQAGTGCDAGIPRLDPRKAALFKFADDLGGDFGVNVAHVPAAARLARSRLLPHGEGSFVSGDYRGSGDALPLMSVRRFQARG